MFTIGRMPGSSRTFLQSVRNHFTRRAWGHFWRLVAAMAIGSAMSIDQLSRLLRKPGTTHRTKHGEFLWQSRWDESLVLQELTGRALRRVHRHFHRRSQSGGTGNRKRKGKKKNTNNKNQRRHGARQDRAYLIFDDSSVEKRGRKIEGLGLIHDHVTKRWINGHLILKAVIHYRGVTLPWATWVYLKRPDAAKLGRAFMKRTEMVAEMIAAAPLEKILPGVRIVVLFDMFYMSKDITRAVEDRGWTWVSIAKYNRRFTPEGTYRSSVLKSYGNNLLRRKGKAKTVDGLHQRHRYRLAERIGTIPKMGRVKLVVNRRHGSRNIHHLVSNDLRSSGVNLLQDYLKRWSIEVLIKEQKQHLGLSSYRMRRYAAVNRYLHLTDCAQTCLTHAWLDQSLRAQGDSDNGKDADVLRVPPISQLRSMLRQRMWRETIQEVIQHSHERPVTRRLQHLLAA